MVSSPLTSPRLPLLTLQDLLKLAPVGESTLRRHLVRRLGFVPSGGRLLFTQDQADEILDALACARLPQEPVPAQADPRAPSTVEIGRKLQEHLRTRPRRRRR